MASLSEQTHDEGGVCKLPSLQEIAAKRQKYREEQDRQANTATSSLEALEEQLHAAQSAGDATKVVLLKRLIKKKVISSHALTAPPLPSAEKLDYDDFADFEFYGQRIYLGGFAPHFNRHSY